LFEYLFLKIFVLAYLEKTEFRFTKNSEPISFLELSFLRSELSSGSSFVHLLSLVDKLKEVLEHEDLQTSHD